MFLDELFSSICLFIILKYITIAPYKNVMLKKSVHSVLKWK